MKKCLAVLLLWLLLAGGLAACTPLGEFIRDAEATDAAATAEAATAEAAAAEATDVALAAAEATGAAAATQTAAPTATFTPSPTPTATDTPVPSPTATATETPAASPSPGPTTTPVPFALPEGWQDYGGEGFALALPGSWDVVEVDREGIDVILEALASMGTEWAEGVAASISAEQMEEALRLWAMDSELAGLGYATLNLQRQQTPISLPVSLFLDQMEATYEQLGVEVVSVEPGMRVNDLEAGRICVRMTQGMLVVKMYQYVFVQGHDLWALSMGVDEEAWSEYEPLFAQIAGTFRLD